MTLGDIRRQLGRPMVGGLFCSLLALPARPFGHEVAQAFRRAIDYVVSKSDTLFDLVANSPETADMVRLGQAWGAWIVYGLFTGLIAMGISRFLARRPLSWISDLLVLAVWTFIYLAVWNWDNELRFAFGGFSNGSAPCTLLPHGGSFGFLGGLAPGLVVMARFGGCAVEPIPTRSCLVVCWLHRRPPG